jgi:hypothetical protein
LDTNPDLDVTMTLSAFRTKLSIRLASLHVHAHRDENCELELLPRPEQLNVLADRLATEQLTSLLSSTRYPHAAPIFGMAQDVSKVGGKAHSRTKSPSTKSERTSKSAIIGPTTSMIPSIGLPIE